MKILFLGDSHTTTNELPRLIEELLRGRKHNEVEIVVQAEPDSHFESHWESARSRELLKQGDWDFVVLQDRPQEADDSGKFMNYGTQLVKEAKAHGAKEVLLFDPWLRYGHFEDQYTFNDAYERLAESTEAHVVPVGEAWSSTLQAYPDIRLHDSDNFHASPSGSYLSACVFFRAFTGENPVGLTSRVQWQGQPLVSIEATEAEKLQEMAEAIMEEIWP